MRVARIFEISSLGARVCTIGGKKTNGSRGEYYYIRVKPADTVSPCRTRGLEGKMVGKIDDSTYIHVCMYTCVYVKANLVR